MNYSYQMLSDYGQSTASETLDRLGQPLEEYFFCQITNHERGADRFDRWQKGQWTSKNMAIHMLDIQHDPTLKWVSGHWSNFGGKAIPISPPVSCLCEHGSHGSVRAFTLTLAVWRSMAWIGLIEQSFANTKTVFFSNGGICKIAFDITQQMTPM